MWNAGTKMGKSLKAQKRNEMLREERKKRYFASLKKKI